MKITQNNDRLTIISSGLKTVLFGLVFTIVGVELTVSFLQDAKSYVPIFFSAVFGLVGVMLISFSKKRTIIIEQEQTCLIDKYVIGGKPNQQTISTADIIAVNLDVNTNVDRDSDGTTSKTRTGSLALVLKNNDLIKIESSSGGFDALTINGLNLGSLISKAPLSKEAEQIAAFLQVPMQSTTS